MVLLASEFDPRELLCFKKESFPRVHQKNQLLGVGPRLYKALFHIPMELL